MATKKDIKTCILCGKTYKYCPKCNHELPEWMSIYDSEDCMTIFEVTRDYGHKLISAEKAKNLLSGCNLDNKENFRTENKKLLDEILGQKASKTVVVKEVKQPIVKEENKADNKTDVQKKTTAKK